MLFLTVELFYWKFCAFIMQASLMERSSVDRVSKLSLGTDHAGKSFSVGYPVCSIIRYPGFPIKADDIKAQVTAPYGYLLPVQVTPQRDGSVQLQYTSVLVGSHSLDAKYFGQAIPGSPLKTEIYDPKKVLIEVVQSGEVMMPVVVNVSRQDAGVAQVSIMVTGPNKQNMPFDVKSIPTGDQITYIPKDPGTYEICVILGTTVVPACPFRLDIQSKGHKDEQIAKAEDTDELLRQLISIQRESLRRQEKQELSLQQILLCMQRQELSMQQQELSMKQQELSMKRVEEKLDEVLQAHQAAERLDDDDDDSGYDDNEKAAEG